MVLNWLLTGLISVLGLLSVGDEPAETFLFIITAVTGLLVSFWQQKNKNLPYLKVIINILLIALAFKAILPFFFKGHPDLLWRLIKTWIYFLILLSFIVYSPRDHYTMQVISLGLIVFSCFYAMTKPLVLLGYILGFSIVWIIALRLSGVLPQIQERKAGFSKVKFFSYEIRLIAALILCIIIISVVFYLFIPRFKINLPLISRLLQQRYSSVYIDFPRKNIVSFLSQSPEKIPETPGEKTSISKAQGLSTQATERLISDSAMTKPLFIHGEELKNELNKLEQKIKEIDNQVLNIVSQPDASNLKDTLQGRQMLLKKKTGLLENKKELEKTLKDLEETYLKEFAAKNAIESSEPPDKNSLSQIKEKIQNIEEKMQAEIKKRSALNKEVDRLNAKLEEIMTFIHTKSMSLAKLLAKREDIEKKLELSKTKINELPNELKLMLETTPPPQARKETKNRTFIDLLIYILIISLVIYAFAFIMQLFLPFIKQKRKLKRASLNRNYHLSICFLYNFLCRVLIFFGYKYPVMVNPQDYVKDVSERFKTIATDYRAITELFIEARYSLHEFSKVQEEKAFSYYRNILRGLKQSGSFWQNIILSIGFVFDL